MQFISFWHGGITIYIKQDIINNTSLGLKRSLAHRQQTWTNCNIQNGCQFVTKWLIDKLYKLDILDKLDKPEILDVLDVLDNLDRQTI